MKEPQSLWISPAARRFVVSVTCPSRYRHGTLFLLLSRDRPAMIIPLDIAVWLAAGAVFFVFVVALAAD
jgi:hypothetical protein